MRRRKQGQVNDGGNSSEDTQDWAKKERRTAATQDVAGHPTQTLSIILFLCRTIGCFLFAYGMFLGQTQLCTHEECDMTYSMRQFLELDMKRSRSSSLSHYRLFKFIDQRDPRHSKFRRYEQPLQGNEWCLDPAQTTAVLYVPGHGGSYEQSRSLGAHGLQLTQRQNAGHPRRILHGLQHNFLTGNSSALESFVFDVYALDFGEEGAGLHGGLVESQSAMVADAVEFLIQSCRLGSITIVAHSIGGYATRLALVDFPELRSLVQNVVTLATPHARPVLAIEPSIHRVHHRLNQEIPSVALVSIGGGLRDEMIPPHAIPAVNALNLGAVDIMSASKRKPPSLGMDHRAIVWCRNLLLTVREIIFTLVLSGENEGQQRLQEVVQRLELPDYDYLTFTKGTRAAYVESFGRWRSILAENGLLYMIEHLVEMYAISSAMYLMLGVAPWGSVVIICLAPALTFQTTNSSYSWLSLYILSLVSNAVFILLFVCARQLSVWICKTCCWGVLYFAFGTFLIFALVLFSVSMFIPRHSSNGFRYHVQILVLAMMPTAILLHFYSRNSSARNHIYSAWILVTLPLFSSGLFYATLIRQISVSDTDICAVALFITLLPAFRTRTKEENREFGLLANVLRVACLIVASAFTSSPGAGSLQFVLLLPMFRVIDMISNLLVEAK